MGIGLTSSFWVAVALLLVVTFGLGVIGPLKQAYLHSIIPSEHRASVVSFDSMIGNAGGMVGQGGLGWLSRARSIPDGFLAGSVITFLSLPVVLALRRLAEPSDRFGSSDAGKPGPCAAQGLPEVGLVDSTPRQAAD